MPEATIKATADHGVLRGDTVHGTTTRPARYSRTSRRWESATTTWYSLEDEGVSKFESRGTRCSRRSGRDGALTTMDQGGWRSSPRWRPRTRRDSGPGGSARQPAARPTRPAYPAGRRAVRAGHVRRHRRPCPQEADAGLYDLANRGLLPPGFSLVGYARRDWEHEDFAQLTYEAVKEHARTRSGRRLAAAVGGCPVRPG